MVELFNKKQFDEAVKEAEAVRRLYPQYVDDLNPYQFLSEIATGTRRQGRRRSRRSPTTGSTAARTRRCSSKLASLQEEGGRLEDAAATLDDINDIYPVNDEDLHHRLGDLWRKQNNNPGAIREYGAVVAGRPLDKAGALYNLAGAYFAANQLDKAEQNVLGALEAAPGYRPAQTLLLQIEDATPRRPR